MSNNNISEFSKEGGSAGTGDCKRRSPEHYQRCVQIRIQNMNKRFAERFWSRVIKGDGDSCWNWIAAKKPSGYGKMSHNGKLESAHRLSWEMLNGTIPDGLWVLHKCDNPSCVRPDHLYLGTHANNTRDAIERHRFVSGEQHHAKTLIGSKNWNSKLTEVLVKQILQKYQKGIFGIPRLSKLFNIPKGTIASIVSRKTWKHVIV